MPTSRIFRIAACAAACAGLVAPSARAAVPPERADDLSARAFFVPELSITSANVPLADVGERLPNRAAWEALAARTGGAVVAFVDPRSGAATNILESVPLLPGDGAGNRLTLADVGRRLGRSVPSVDAAVVADAVLAHVRDRRDVLGIDPAQLGTARSTLVTDDLWQVSIPQRYRGVPVRHGRLVASISHGNLVALGAETWGDVALAGVTPSVDAAGALEAGFAHAGGRASEDEILAEPSLEIVPTAPPALQDGERFAGPIGRGYAHRLAWTFEFRRPPAVARWQVTVDAQSGAVLAMEDQNQYAARQVTGGVYPSTNTEICPIPSRCGRLQERWPMPFADTGFAAPNDFTNGAGVYDYPGGTAVTHLSGRFVRMNDSCNPFPLGGIEQTSANGAIDLGGVNTNHDCDGSTSGGDTPSARTAYYETNRMAEIARGYLPGNAWVRGLLGANTNFGIQFASSCNAFWNGATVNFYASGNGCRNTGEIAAVIDHEWGHGLDQNDANGVLSSSSEGYADIAAIYRAQDSCVGHGFFETRDFGCGRTADGTGFNIDESQEGPPHCATDCSGVRDADFMKHVDQVPDTPANHVCVRCSAALSGPCGRQTHCAAAPQRQAAWDLAARDLPAFHGVDTQTAFLWASRLFYQGSGNVGSWYACTCNAGGASSSGCAAGNAYMQWLVADDDNGKLSDGTPHMRAIHAAFDRHGIACAQPTPQTGGCAGPAAPTLTVTPGVLQNTLTWTAVPGATRFEVFRSDGQAGCAYGKAKIAEVSGTSFVDTDVATARTYAYAVLAAGASDACRSRASNCATGTPIGGFTVACTPQSVQPGTAVSTCTVQATGAFMSPVHLSCAGFPVTTATCTFDPPVVTPFAGAPATSTLSIQQGVLAQPGTYSFQVRAGSAPNVGGPAVPMTLNVGGGQPPSGDLFALFDDALQAPSCGTVVGRSCDTRTLVAGRASIGPERNQPNTLADSCADGTEGTGSNDRIRVADPDGLPLTRGRKVVVEATVVARDDFEQDAADFYSAADALNPVWQYVGTVVPSGPGPQTLSTAFKLPSGSRQAVRVQFRNGGAPDACAAGPQDDRDDLVFAVAP